MNQFLGQVLAHLQDSKDRVTITYQKYGGSTGTVTGTIELFTDDRVLYRKKSSGGYRYSVARDHVLEIRASRGKPRKSGMYYHLYYQKPPFTPAADGSLDMASALKQLLAVA